MKPYQIKVDGQKIEMSDPMPTADQILFEAGFQPTDQHILIQLEKGASNALGLNQKVNLRGGEPAKFRVFRSDRTFRFLVNRRGFEWGAARISESEIRELANVQDAETLVWEHREGTRELVRSDWVDLSGAGTERLRTLVAEKVAVIVDGEEKQIGRGDYTVDQLITHFGIRENYLLNIVDADGQLRPLEANETISIDVEVEFISQVPCGEFS